MTERIYQCTGCLTLGPREAEPGGAAWLHDGEGGWRHGCGAEAPAPCRPLDPPPFALAMTLHDRLYAQAAYFNRRVRVREAIIAMLLAEAVAHAAPPAWWTLAAVVALCARALWGFAHAALDALLSWRPDLRVAPTPKR